MGNITLNKPSGGQLTLSPEDGTSTETVTIPSVGVGKVLQVVSTFAKDTTTTTSSSLVDVVGASVTITPISSTSKMIIAFSAGGLAHNNSGAKNNMLAINRNGTLIVHRERHTYTDIGGGWQNIVWDISHVDEPATTSTLTYKIQFATSTSESRVNDYYTNSNNRGLTMYVMEVAA